MREMAINLGKIADIGSFINLRCTSRTGELLRISVHEFHEKVLGTTSYVHQSIKENVHNKLQSFINKTGSRYEKIKDFNSKHLVPIARNKSPMENPDIN